MDTVYFEIIENLKEDVCVICHMKDRAMDKFFDDFLYESVNDYKLREIMRKEGICPKHAKKLESFGDVLAHAIIYSDILSNFINNQLNGASFTSKTKNRVLICPFCEQERKFADTYSKAFSQYFSKSEEFRRNISEKGFLCKNHFLQILDLLSVTALQKELKEVMKKRLQNIMEHLERIKEKNDYRNIHINYTHDEVRAWHTAVRFIAGE